MYIGDLKVNTSTVGEIDVTNTKGLLNNLLYVSIPFINMYLNGVEFTVPSDIFGIFLLKDLNLAYYDHFIEVGLTPVFQAGQSKVKEFIEELIEPMTFLQ